MDLFQLFSFVILVTAFFSFINCRFLKLPNSIALMLCGLTLALIIIVLGESGLFEQSINWAKNLVELIKFDQILMRGMLGIILFAGALHMNLDEILEHKLVIGFLATFGVVFSTFFIAFIMKLTLNYLAIDIPFLHCLLFGALISPTDPIAVLSILKSLGVSKSLQTKISGESLFNDGVSVVLFTVILGAATHNRDIEIMNVSLLLLKEFVGGVALGIVGGLVAYKMLLEVDDYITEILITLALVLFGGTVAEFFHVSGPLAAVSGGLLIGNRGRSFAMSEKVREHLDFFWHLLDEILNSILFVLLGLEILILTFNVTFVKASLIAIPVVLLSRYLGVVSIIFSLKKYREFGRQTVNILTWGGLRGGVSIALALAIPNTVNRELILNMTFGVVLFSVFVQGLTIKKLLKE